MRTVLDDKRQTDARWSEFLQIFENAKDKDKISLNGGVFSLQLYRKLKETFKKCKGVMIGSGAIVNPNVFREIKDYENGFN